MIQLSNTTEQVLQPGQAIAFDDVILHSGCGECHRNGTSSIKMRANGVYSADFHGNVTASAAGPIQLSLALTGDTYLPETKMDATIAAEGNLYNVGTDTLIKNCCGDYDRVSVVNTGTTACTIAPNCSFKVTRMS